MGVAPNPRSWWSRTFGARRAVPTALPSVLTHLVPETPTPAEALAKALVDLDEAAALSVVESCDPAAWTFLPSGMHVLEHLWEHVDDAKHDTADSVRVLTRHMLDRGLVLPEGFGARLFNWAVQQKASQYSLCMALLAAGVDARGERVTKSGRVETWVRHCLRTSRPRLALELLKRGADALEVESDGSTLLHTVALATSVREAEDDDVFGMLMMLGDFEERRQPGRRKDEEPGNVFDALVEVMEFLCAAGVPVDAHNQLQQTAYSLAGPRLRPKLSARPGVLRVGMAASGHSLAFEAARGGRLEELAVLWKGDPASFLTADACGCLPSWAWWDVSNPTASGNLIAWFKHHGVWHESVAFTVEGRRNFLMHGLQKASKKKAASDGEVDLLDWQLARLETELPASMWVSPDASGETLPFWLRAMGRHDMVERYVQPRKEAFLQASLAHVEATQPAKPRPRF